MMPNHLFQLVSLIGDGAAQLVRRRRGARREGQGDSRASSRCIPTSAIIARCAASMARARSTGSRSPAIAHEPNVNPDFGHRDIRRAEAHHRQLALGRRSLLPAHRKAAWRSASARSRSSSSSLPSCCSAQTPVEHLQAEPAGDSDSARGRHLAAHRREDPRAVRGYRRRAR